MTLDEMLPLVVFARVVETGSFTAAARVLGVSKSVVSERVSLLEARLGVRLLHRTTRRLSLTTDGGEVYERCARMVGAAHEAYALAAGAGDSPRGTLRVTAPVLFGQLWLGELTARLAHAHPALRVEVVLSDTAVDVVGERFDVAVRVSPRPPVGELHARRVARDCKRLCAAPAYLERHGTPSDALEVSRHRCLRFSPVDVRTEWTLHTPAGPVLPSVSGPYEANDVGLLRDAAVAGLGLAMLPGYALVDALASGQLVEVLPEASRTPLLVHALYAPGRRTPAKVRAFTEALARHLRGCPWNKG